MISERKKNYVKQVFVSKFRTKITRVDRTNVEGGWSNGLQRGNALVKNTVLGWRKITVDRVLALHVDNLVSVSSSLIFSPKLLLRSTVRSNLSTLSDVSQKQKLKSMKRCTLKTYFGEIWISLLKHAYTYKIRLPQYKQKYLKTITMRVKCYSSEPLIKLLKLCMRIILH